MVARMLLELKARGQSGIPGLEFRWGPAFSSHLSNAVTGDVKHYFK